MIGFLIFYFVFSAMFALGVRVYDNDEVPFMEFVLCALLGWSLLPFGLGMLVSKIINDDKNE